MTLSTLLADAAARVPDRPALAAGGDRISYAELDAMAARAAGALQERGVGRGDAVALVVPGEESCDADAVKAFVRERVAAYKYPRLVLVVDELPHGATGKIQRREIDRAALAERVARGC